MRVLVVGSGGVGESTAAIAKRRDPKGEIFEKMVMADYDLAKAQALMANYPPGRQASAVIGVLDLAQRQQGRHEAALHEG